MRYFSGIALLALAGSAQAAPVALVNDRLFIPATVNGTAVEALLDSGAEMSVLDNQFADRLKLASNVGEDAKGSGGGSVKARFAPNVDIVAGGVALSDRMVAIIDLEDVSARLVKRPVAMIVGRDYFDGGRVRLDLAAGSIEPVGRDAPPRGTRLDLVTRKGIETMSVSIEGAAETRADFDLGNGSEVIIGRAYAERLGLTAPNRIIERRAGGGLGGSVEREIVVLKSLVVAGEKFENVPAAIDPRAEADVNVGTAVLKEFRMTIDFPQHALWLERIR